MEFKTCRRIICLYLDEVEEGEYTMIDLCFLPKCCYYTLLAPK